jgi:hypothetical protein
MTLSVRARLIAWYSAVMVGLLGAAAFAAGAMLIRLGIHRLDADLLGIAATVQSIMRDEAREGMDLAGGAHEASSEVTSPGVNVILTADNGKIVASWGEPLPAHWETTPGWSRKCRTRPTRPIAPSQLAASAFAWWNARPASATSPLR